MKALKASRFVCMSVAVCVLGFAGNLQAKSLGLLVEYPDVGLTSTPFTYLFGPTSGEFGGAGGTFTISGGGGIKMSLKASVAASQNILTGSAYALTAFYNAAGAFTGGSVAVTGTPSTAVAGYGSGTIVTSPLTSFGWFGDGADGTFEFGGTPNGALVGGDWGVGGFGFNAIGVLAHANQDVFCGASACVGNWDPPNTNDTTFWTQSFSGSVNVDTFIPVPAALWLLGSGLLGLVGFGRYRNKRIAAG